MKYLNKLSLNEIISIFKKINIYPFIYTDNNGEPISLLIKGENYYIYKAKVEKNDKEIQNDKFKKLVQENLCQQYSYLKDFIVNDFLSNKIILIRLSDFSAYTMDTEETTELDKLINKTYVNYLKEKFNTSYDKDQDKYFENL